MIQNDFALLCYSKHCKPAYEETITSNKVVVFTTLLYNVVNF